MFYKSLSIGEYPSRQSIISLLETNKLYIGSPQNGVILKNKRRIMTIGPSFKNCVTNKIYMGSLQSGVFSNKQKNYENWTILQEFCEHTLKYTY